VTRDIGRTGVVVGMAAVLLSVGMASVGTASGLPGDTGGLSFVRSLGWATRPTVPPPPRRRRVAHRTLRTLTVSPNTSADYLWGPPYMASIAGP
jgi:hypothetical protein